jgi:flavin-dependent dehydrogenase
MSSDKLDTDVLVIGGGPAGLAAAVAARRKGFRVMVADSARPPVDKACGEGIMPDGLRALSELGFSLAAAGPAPFRGIRFVDGGIRAEAAFPNGHGLGVRRTALHSAIAAAAESAGAELLWGSHVTGIGRNGVRVGGRILKSRWIIGADGLRSRVRDWAGLDGYRSFRRRFGFRRHFHTSARPEYMELHWGRGVQLYLTPVGASEICAVVISRDPHLRLEQALAQFPQAATFLGTPVGPAETGSITLSRRFARVTSGQIALVGDASGSVDAITGEGLCLAFRQSLALAEALERGDLSVYETAHRRLMRGPALMGTLLLSLDSMPRLRRCVLRAFQAKPALFEKMLAAHVGTIQRGESPAVAESYSLAVRRIST